MSLVLGVIADDFTGATDLANNLVRAGMRVLQHNGVPAADEPAAHEVDAVVVALKSRTAPVAQAVAETLAAARWLRASGARQLYFKVCSTFDSTPRGNIGPVAEALMTLTQAPFVPVTPAFPTNGRSVYQGHLFVGEQLLSDSGMRQHPLTPMTDANLRRVLQPQLARERVGLIAHADVALGGPAIAARAAALRAAGVRLAIVDAIDGRDLAHLARAAADWPLVVAGSGLGAALPAQWGFSPDAEVTRLPPACGAAAIVSGSCSPATQAQVAAFIAAGGAARPVDALRAAAGADVVGELLDWALPRLGARPLLVYATAAAEQLRGVQAQLGAQRAGALVEELLARIAVRLVQAGVGRLVLAGGETSGACVQALGLRRLRIGVQIDPGVPWCHAAERGLHLALKSGNFGSPDFFDRAFRVLETG